MLASRAMHERNLVFVDLQHAILLDPACVTAILLDPACVTRNTVGPSMCYRLHGMLVLVASCCDLLRVAFCPH